MSINEQLKQWVIGVGVPLLTGGIVTWLAGQKVLALLHLGTKSAAGLISAALVFAVTTGFAWLSSHHILRGHYTPAAKADTSA